MAAERELDLVLFGATGFVGRLTAEYLAAAGGDAVRIGLAGRSREKLERLRAQLGERASQWGLIVAECHDTAALKEMAGRARAVATTVGPYRKYGIARVRPARRRVQPRASDVVRALRDGAGQHAGGAPVQRPPGVGLRAALSLPRGDGPRRRRRWAGASARPGRGPGRPGRRHGGTTVS